MNGQQTQVPLHPLAAILEQPRVRRGILIALILFGLGLGWSTVYRAAFGRVERTDFTVYTAAGRAVIEGTDIYEAENARGWLYMYLPIFAILMVPLAPLPVALSSAIWYLLSVAMLWHMLWMSAALARRFFPAAQWSVFWLAMWALLGIFWPAMSGMARGQASVLVAWLVTLGIWAWFERRPWLAGAGLAGAIVLKVFPGLFMVYFLFKRQWMMLTTTSVWLALMILVLPSFVFGPVGNYKLLHRWVTTIALPATDADNHERDPRYAQMADPRLERNQSVHAVAIRLIAPDDEIADATGREDLAELIGKIVSGVLLLITAWACRNGPADQKDARLLIQFALVILLMLFISPVSWSHSFALMALPLAIVAAISSILQTPRRSALHTAVYTTFIAVTGIGAAVKPLQEAGVLLWASLLVWALLLRDVHQLSKQASEAEPHAPSFPAAAPQA